MQKTKNFYTIFGLSSFLVIVFGAKAVEKKEQNYLRHLVIDVLSSPLVEDSAENALSSKESSGFVELSPEIRGLITELKIYQSGLNTMQGRKECRELLSYLRVLERRLKERFRGIKEPWISDVGQRIGGHLNPLLQFGRDNCDLRMDPLWSMGFGQKDGFFVSPTLQFFKDSVQSTTSSGLNLGNRGSLVGSNSLKLTWLLTTGLASQFQSIYFPFLADAKAYIPLSSKSAIQPSIKLEVSPNLEEPQYLEKVQTDFQVHYGVGFASQQLSVPFKVDLGFRQGFSTGGLYNHNLLVLDFVQELGESGLERSHSIKAHFEKKFASEQAAIGGIQQVAVSYLLQGQTFAGGEGKLEVGLAENRTQSRKLDLSPFVLLRLQGKYFYENFLGLSTLPSIEIYSRVSTRPYETLVRDYSIKPKLVGRLYRGQAQVALGLLQKVERPVSEDIVGRDFELSSTSLNLDTKVLFSKNWTLEAELDFGIRKYRGPNLNSFLAGVRLAALRDGFYYSAGLGLNYVF